MENYIEFEEKIGYTFRDKKLLASALTHTSYANEHHTDSFERLEFLGDSILGFVVAEKLFDMYGIQDEGFLSRMRASIVCENALSDVARTLRTPSYIRLGVGEEKSRGREKNSIISDVVEALIAAIYKDSNLEEARAFINRIIPESAYTAMGTKDYKTKLQETYKHSQIQYNTKAYTEDGVEVFKSSVCIDGEIYGVGNGTSKKIAEQNAAQQALEK